MHTKLKILFLIFLSLTIAQANDRYIVVLKDKTVSYSINKSAPLLNDEESIRQTANRLLNIPNVKSNTKMQKDSLSNNENKIIYIYDKVLYGFAADLNSATFQDLKNNPEIKYIKKDTPVYLDDQPPLESNRIDQIVQSPTPSWGLDRIDQRDKRGNNQYSYKYTGKGVHVYVLDSGINYEHNDFIGRIDDGYNFDKHTTRSLDCQHHGTFISGIIVGTKYGVAKQAIIHPVKVFLGCDRRGYSSDTIAALNWVVNHHKKPAVINLSMHEAGSNIKNAIDNDNFTRHNIPIVVAAGNDNRDACTQNPASSSYAITVAASTKDDKKANYSNFGSCIDVFAPGSSVTSAYINGVYTEDDGYGTSYAAPYVTGVVAKYLEKYPNATAQQVSDFIISNSTKNKLEGLDSSSPNRLLYGVIDIADED